MVPNKNMLDVLRKFQGKARFSLWGGLTPNSPTIILWVGGYMFQPYEGINFWYYINCIEKDIWFHFKTKASQSLLGVVTMAY
jgi:hypothetical protein